jgi:hypothetical protein
LGISGVVFDQNEVHRAEQKRLDGGFETKLENNQQKGHD